VIINGTYKYIQQHVVRVKHQSLLHTSTKTQNTSTALSCCTAMGEVNFG